MITFELSKLPKYRLPKRERGFTDLEEANQSGNDILSNSHGNSGYDNDELVRRAMDRKFKELGINEEEEKEGMFGEKILNDESHPKMRYSIQGNKNKFNTSDNSKLDDRKIISEPDIKYKDQDPQTMSSHSQFKDLLADIRNEKEKKIEPKEERKETLSSNSVKKEEGEENNKTDDRPSVEEEKKLEISGKFIYIS